MIFCLIEFLLYSEILSYFQIGSLSDLFEDILLIFLKVKEEISYSMLTSFIVKPFI